MPVIEDITTSAALAAKVDKLSCVRFGSARYSVPSRLIGAAALIRVTKGRVRILEVQGARNDLPPRLSSHNAYWTCGPGRA